MMDQLRLLQIKDDFCKKTIQRVMRNQKKDKQLAYPYYIKTGLLHRLNTLRMANKDLKHKSFQRTVQVTYLG